MPTENHKEHHWIPDNIKNICMKRAEKSPFPIFYYNLWFLVGWFAIRTHTVLISSPAENLLQNMSESDVPVMRCRVVVKNVFSLHARSLWQLRYLSYKSCSNFFKKLQNLFLILVMSQLHYDGYETNSTWGIMKYS